MKVCSLLKLASVLAASVLTLSKANAQSWPNGDHLIGNQTGRFYIQGVPANTEGPYIQFNPNNDTYSSSQGSVQGALNYIAGYSATSSNIAHSFVVRQYQGSNIGWPSYMRMLQSGQVQIGTYAPQTQTDYALAVDGKIVTKSLFVTTPANWADFVFAPSYHPMSLAKLETYLQRNKHLPAIPSATEVESKGYSVTEMDAKLLQSLEELTLHVIELNKQNAQLAARLAQVEQQLAARK